MTNEKITKARRLSIVIGVSFSSFFVVFSSVGLLWTYISTGQFVGKQLADTFDQKHLVAENIVSYQKELLQYSIRSIKGHKKLKDIAIYQNPEQSEKILVEIVEAVQELPLDILFLSISDNVVHANASSPFFNTEMFLPLIARFGVAALSDGEILHLSIDGENLTVLMSATILADAENGRVIGSLYGGIVLGDNVSLLNQIKRETKSEAIYLLSGGAVIGSTTRAKHEEILRKLNSREATGVFPGFWAQNVANSFDSQILSKKMRISDDSLSEVEIVFAIPDQILVDIREAYLTKGVTLLVGGVFILLLSIFIVRRLTIVPFKSLLKYSQEVSEGDTNPNFQDSNILEFNQIGRAMETMVEGLQNMNEMLQEDIQARVLAERALKKSELHFRTLVETIPELVWLKDKDGFYLSCNPRFELFFGAKQEDIIGKTDYDFVDKKLADFFRKHDKKAMLSDKPCINEEEVTYASDGHKEYLETIKTPVIGDDGSLIGVMGIARDISERKEAEKAHLALESQLRQAHKMEAIGTMAGGIAHDFNNILAAILGYSEMARNEVGVNHPAKRFLDQVVTASQRAKELIRHILTFSSMSGTSKGFVPVDVGLTVKEILQFQRSVIPSTVQITSDIDTNNRLVNGNPTQIHQVLMNLCTNASHAMEQTGGALHVTVKTVVCKESDLIDDPNLKPGNYTRLTVSDTGEGMTAKVLDRIFDPYYTTKEVGKGTGMGLSVVLGIVKSHNGFMKVESKPAAGSSFNLFFPASDELPKETKKEVADEPVTGTENILFVDDEEMLADIGQRVLETLGYSVTVETDSVNALELFKKDPTQFDLVITDQTMPNLTGSELATKILKLNPDIPIILCTGYSSKVDERKAADIGISAFLNKPVEINTVATTVRNVLDRE